MCINKMNMNFSRAVNVFATRVTYSACFIQHYFMARTVTTFRFTLLGVLYLLLKSHHFCAYSFGVRTSDDSDQLTGCTCEEEALYFRRVTTFFFSPLRPDQLWSQATLSCKVCRSLISKLKRSERDTLFHFHLLLAIRIHGTIYTMADPSGRAV